MRDYSKYLKFTHKKSGETAIYGDNGERDFHDSFIVWSIICPKKPRTPFSYKLWLSKYYVPESTNTFEVEYANEADLEKALFLELV